MLEHSLARARDTGGSLSLALLDVDHFKQVNDHHGHAAGDAVLRIVARVLSTQARHGDVLARVGGEEFALLLPRTTGAQARVVCERLRKAVAAQSIVLPPGTTCSVTLSAGVAELGGRATPDSLLAVTDAALYEAKHSGRNMVKLAA
jgi:diguanylate cyclase (GGDEF)-like protein